MNEYCQFCTEEPGKSPDCIRCSHDIAAKRIQDSWLGSFEVDCMGVNVAPAFGHIIRAITMENLRETRDETASPN